MSVLRKSAYAKWIAENRPADPWGKCEALTRLMATAFPELRRVRGHYVCPLQGRLTLVFGDEKVCNEKCLAEITAYLEDSADEN
jgi:hypothetical protein